MSSPVLDIFRASQPPTTGKPEHLPNSLWFLCCCGADFRGVLDCLQNPQMFSFQVFEFIVKLLVPRVQDEHLKPECRGRDEEVRQGDATGENHLDRLARNVSMDRLCCAQLDWALGRQVESLIERTSLKRTR